jgi:hypothetical protein
MNNILGASAWTLKEDALQQYGYDDVDKVCVIYIHVHSYDARERVCLCIRVCVCVCKVSVCACRQSTGRKLLLGAGFNFFLFFLASAPQALLLIIAKGIPSCIFFFSSSFIFCRALNGVPG